MKSKRAIRESVWTRLQEHKLARFPFPIKNRIPNFKGAEAAVELLRQQSFYQKATNLKCNPDSPQLPLRLQALKDGKMVFMAVPRLREEKCFICLDPHKIDSDDYRKASSIKGAFDFGHPVTPQNMPVIDLISAGSVAVRRDGARIGKGGGYSDLEFAIGRELGIITNKSVIISTVHDEQVVDESWEIQPYDIPLDHIITPTQVIKCKSPHMRPQGIYWDLLKPEMKESIPILTSVSDKKY